MSTNGDRSMRRVLEQGGEAPGKKSDSIAQRSEADIGIDMLVPPLSDILPDLLRLRVVRFVLVGVFGATVELGLFSVLLAAQLGIVVANIVAFHIAFALCFALHFFYTHRYSFSERHFFLRGFVSYATLMYGQLAFGTLLLWLLIDKAGLAGELAKLLQIAVVTPVGYLIQKTLIFQKPEP